MPNDALREITEWLPKDGRLGFYCTLRCSPRRGKRSERRGTALSSGRSTVGSSLAGEDSLTTRTNGNNTGCSPLASLLPALGVVTASGLLKAIFIPQLAEVRRARIAEHRRVQDGTCLLALTGEPQPLDQDAQHLDIFR